jgi:hypothetical protein
MKAALCAHGFCLVGLILFLRYAEKRVLAVLAKKESLSSEGQS